MIHADHAFVPAGTLRDVSGNPVTVRRDFAAVDIPAMRLDVDGLDQLRQILASVRPDMIAAWAEEQREAAEAEERLPDTVAVTSLRHGDYVIGRSTVEAVFGPDEAGLVTVHYPNGAWTVYEAADTVLVERGAQDEPETDEDEAEDEEPDPDDWEPGDRHGYEVGPDDFTADRHADLDPARGEDYGPETALPDSDLTGTFDAETGRRTP